MRKRKKHQLWGKRDFFTPLTKPRSKGRFLEKGAGSVTLNLKIQFLWGSGRGSNDKLINNFPFSLVGLGISCVAEILCSLCLQFRLFPVSGSTGTAA